MNEQFASVMGEKKRGFFLPKKRKLFYLFLSLDHKEAAKSNMLKRVFLVSARILLCTNREADYLSHAAASSVLAISHFLPLSESPPRSCITCITCKFYAVCCQRRAQFFNLHKHWVGCGRCSSAQRHSFGVPAAMHMGWSADTGIFF